MTKDGPTLSAIAHFVELERKGGVEIATRYVYGAAILYRSESQRPCRTLSTTGAATYPDYLFAFLQ